jgi:hypothetical protein
MDHMGKTNGVVACIVLRPDTPTTRFHTSAARTFATAVRAAIITISTIIIAAAIIATATFWLVC